SSRSLQGFNSFIDDMEMAELPMQGYKFTWCNLRSEEGLVEEKLDRALASNGWILNNPNATVSNIVRSASDHSMILLNQGHPQAKTTARFHFDKRWLTRADLNAAHNQEELHWQQRAKLNWLKEGDANTKFFHAYTIQKRKLNAITRLLSPQGLALTTQEDIELHVSEFYRDLFTAERSSGGESIINLIPKSISEDMNQALLKPVSEEEVKEALFSLPADKSPGEDGMNAIFYQHFWTLVKDDVLAAILSFFQSGVILKYWNHTILSLVPKTAHPETLANFRPISLCSVIYKILSTVLAQRLRLCLMTCISPHQSAFVKDRQLMDNIVIAQEAFHFLNRHSSGKNFFIIISYIRVGMARWGNSASFSRQEFRFAFWAFGPATQSFLLCPPIISIDGTCDYLHLRGSYKGKLLVNCKLSFCFLIYN
ncbi:Unknown protein, partial [Striga hermonthica]